ncbi:Transcriptional regulator, TetR family [Corynebacterium urogenitale]|uniref:Transcriptional regulator, TetR family n=1 Tax=Corynebacterium urogenitale TaxID=2487892 RepID=A0A5J6Z8B5_9CORY|nr:TetR/AcrR family transcriptional regulator [Corynebacterium urogenitale]QFQ01873.1 Transcriptional regulator, TetR family [Corynebacterium urogenitale]
MRADALQRRERIVGAARELFATRGRDISLGSVAERAGVGIGTLYRNFSSREELVRAVAMAVMGDLVASVKEVGQRSAEPEAWRELIRSLARLNLGAFTDVQAVVLDDDVAAEQQRALAKLEELLASFQRAGVVRGEVDAQEMIVALAIITRPQPEAIVHAAPNVADTLLESYIQWTELR